MLAGLIAHPGFYGVVAERDGTIIGSSFMDERSTISGIGPVTVDPTTQNGGVGKQLMQHLLDRATSQGTPGVRLLQAAFHARALTLYAKLGFRVREGMAIMSGPALNMELPGRTVRLATTADLPACDAVCHAVHGHTRHGELEDSITSGTALVVEYGGRVTGYASSLAFFGHAVGRDLGRSESYHRRGAVHPAARHPGAAPQSALSLGTGARPARGRRDEPDERRPL